MRNLIVFLMVLLFISCRKEEVLSCDYTGEVEEIAWLKAMKDSIDDPENCGCNPALVQGESQGQTVFFILPCTAPFCDCIGPQEFRDCNGNIIADLSLNGLNYTLSDYLFVCE